MKSRLLPFLRSKAVKHLYKLSQQERNRTIRRLARRQVRQVFEQHQEQLRQEQLAREEELAFEEMERAAFFPDLDEDAPRPRSQVDEQFEREYYEWVDATEEDFEREWDDDPRAAEEAEADALLEEADELIASTDQLLAELDEENRHP